MAVKYTFPVTLVSSPTTPADVFFGTDDPAQATHVVIAVEDLDRVWDQLHDLRDAAMGHRFQAGKLLDSSSPDYLGAVRKLVTQLHATDRLLGYRR